MHLPDGAVSPGCAAVAACVAGSIAVPALLFARKCAPRHPWRLAMASALVFAAQGLNVQILPGVSAHVIGAFLLAWSFGAVWGSITMSAIVALQAIVFGDGGAMALGVNVINMAVVPCLVVYPLWKRRGCGTRAGAMAGAWVSVMAAALAASLALLSNPANRVSLFGQMLSMHALAGLLEAGAMLLVMVLAQEFRRTRLDPAPVLLATAILVAVAAMLFTSTSPDALSAMLGSGSEAGYSFAGTLAGLIALVACMRLFSIVLQPGELHDRQ
jgi:cobalt/nickel transport system permease protein